MKAPVLSAVVGLSLIAGWETDVCLLLVFATQQMFLHWLKTASVIQLFDKANWILVLSWSAWVIICVTLMFSRGSWIICQCKNCTVRISTSAYFRNKVIAKMTCFTVSKVFSVFFSVQCVWLLDLITGPIQKHHPSVSFGHFSRSCSAALKRNSSLFLSHNLSYNSCL